MDESAGLTEAERQAPAVASRAPPKGASWGALLTLPGLAQTPPPPSRAPQLCIATRHVSAMANTTSQRTSVDGSEFPNFLSMCLFSH